LRASRSASRYSRNNRAGRIVCCEGQKRRATPQIKRIKRERRHRAGHRPPQRTPPYGRNYLALGSGDAINAVLAAVGYNLRRLLVWLSFLLLRTLIALGLVAQAKWPETKFFRNDDAVPA
jgi:hypothetical protein